MFTTKIGENNQHFKLLFFTINLHFVTSNKISAYRNLNLSLTSSICLVVLPLEMQRRLKQTNKYHTFFTFSEKKRPKTLKVAAVKALSSIAYAIGNTCFDQCFLLHVITAKDLFLIKVYRYSEIFLTTMFCFL